MKSGYLLLALLLGCSANASAQEFLRPSPVGLATIRYKDSYVKITYGRPQKKNRDVFGSLVPWGEVWRTGANEATEITLTKDVFVNKMLLAAGTYSIFTIPQPDRWTVIINKDVGLWGAYNYNPKQDVLKFDVPTAPLADKTVEAFTINLVARNAFADLVMAWDKMQITVPLQFIEPRP
jgi:hypothetical protein